MRIVIYLRIPQKQGKHLRRKLGAHKDRALSSGVRVLGNDADYSPPFSVEVKNVGVIPPLPLRLHNMVLS
jgi:hypothetical protein